MVKRKAWVSMRAIVASYIFISLLMPPNNYLYGSFRDMLSNLVGSFMFYLIWAVPLMIVVGVPVTLFAGFLTRGYTGHIRTILNFLIHIIPAVLVALVLFHLLFLSVFTGTVALIFFVFDEYALNKSRKDDRKFPKWVFLLPFSAVVTITGWNVYNHYHFEISTNSIKAKAAAGEMELVISSGEDEIEIPNMPERFESEAGFENLPINYRIAPFQAPLDDNLNKGIPKIKAGQGDSLDIHYKNGEPDKIRVIYLMEGGRKEKVLDGSVFRLPDGFRTQTMLIDILDKTSLSSKMVIVEVDD